jgi:hypothetical protein
MNDADAALAAEQTESLTLELANIAPLAEGQ